MVFDANKPDFYAIVERSPWFSILPSEAKTTLASAAKLDEHATGSFIFNIGDTTTHIFCILSGRVRIGLASSAGDEFAIVDREGDTWIGEGCLFGDAGRVLNAQVKESAWVLKIPRSVTLAVGKEFPIMYRAILADHIENTRGMYELLAGMLFYPLKARLAGRIIFLLEAYGEKADGGAYLNVKLSQNDFARLSMGSRQRINKIFRNWNERGIVLGQSDRYFIPSIEALQNEVEPSNA